MTLKSMHSHKGATLGSLSPRVTSAKSIFFESRTCKELMNDKFNRVNVVTRWFCNEFNVLWLWLFNRHSPNELHKLAADFWRICKDFKKVTSQNMENVIKTRKYSSRMRTARFSSSGWGLGRPPFKQTPPGCRPTPTPTADADPSPPVDRQTGVKFYLAPNFIF